MTAAQLQTELKSVRACQEGYAEAIVAHNENAALKETLIAEYVKLVHRAIALEAAINAAYEA